MSILVIAAFIGGLVVEKNIGLFTKAANFIEGAWSLAAAWLKKLFPKS